jgi:hypothetical protein
MNKQPVTSLFEADDEWNDLSRSYDVEVSNVLRPIFEKAYSRGHSLKHLYYIVTSVALEQSIPMSNDKVNE